MPDERLMKLRDEFLERHKDAHYLVLNGTTGAVLGAVYYAPDWHIQDEVIAYDLKRFFTLVEEAELMRNEETDA